MTTKEPMPELKPCPFCGGEAVTHTRFKPKLHNGKTIDWPYKIVKCKNNCDRLSVDGWNTRAPDKIVIDRAVVDSAISCAQKLGLSNIETKAMLGELVVDVLSAQVKGK